MSGVSFITFCESERFFIYLWLIASLTTYNPSVSSGDKSGDLLFIMIQANELRIGNALHKSGVEMHVFGILHDSVILKNVSAEIHHYNLDELNPIPITDEWLVRMGFIYDGLEDSFDENTWYNLQYGRHKFSSDFSVNFSEVFVNCGNIEIMSAKYVHQLQNIHFALTGQELTIKK